MEQFVFYIILGVVWLVIRLVSAGNKNNAKPKPQQGRPAQSQQTGRPTASQEAPKSFEELLRQLGQNVEEQRTTNQPAHREEPRPYYEEHEEYEGQLESVDQSYDDAYTRYEEAIAAGKDFERIEDRVSRLENKETSKRFKSFDKQEEEPSYYAKLLQNPQSARDAIILAEILKRPYE